MDEITDFRGPYRWLSNFHVCDVTLDGVVYPSTEHAYQAAKAPDPAYRAAILACATPGQAKRLSATPASKALVRADWHDVSLGVMLDLLRQKFVLYPELGAKLLATGSAKLVEGNTWGDQFWGVCDGAGHNYLGKQLMHIRAELRHAEALHAIYAG